MFVLLIFTMQNLMCAQKSRQREVTCEHGAQRGLSGAPFVQLCARLVTYCCPDLEVTQKGKH